MAKGSDDLDAHFRSMSVPALRREIEVLPHPRLTTDCLCELPPRCAENCASARKRQYMRWLPERITKPFHMLKRYLSNPVRPSDTENSMKAVWAWRYWRMSAASCSLRQGLLSTMERRLNRRSGDKLRRRAIRAAESAVVIRARRYRRSLQKVCATRRTGPSRRGVRPGGSACFDSTIRMGMRQWSENHRFRVLSEWPVSHRY